MSFLLSRRSALQTLAGALCPQAGQPQGKPDRPNILFIPVDDLNDWVEDFGGHPQTVTPNLHRLSQQGVRFQRAYCQAPMCNPSRASLFTGLRCTTTGVYKNDDTWRDGAKSVVTLTEYFRKYGYRADGLGKTFHSKQTDYSCFDSYFQGDVDDNATGLPDGAKPRKLKGAAKVLQWGGIDVPEEQTGDTQIALEAVRLLKAGYKQPFFLAPGFRKPHMPWYAPKKYFDKFPAESVKLPPYLENDLDDVPRSAIHRNLVDHFHAIRDVGKWKEAVAAYLACINYVDANVGRILDALESSPYRDNTIVMVWGDHGWHLGEKDHWQKFTLWERSCRAPLIVRAPGTKGSGDCHRVVEFLDVYPTLIDLCGLPKNSKLEGRSLKPLLDNPSATWDGVGITSDGPDKITVRTERYRYSRFPDGEELYDEQADPNEWTNLARRAEAKPLMEKLRRELGSRLPVNANRKEPRSWDSLSAAEKRRLRGRS